MAQNHAGAMRLGGQAKERQLLQGAVFPVAKQTWPAKSHLRRRRFSAHRHLPHAQGRNHSPGPRLRLFRPASSRNQGEAVGKPDRQAWLRSHLAAHRQGGLKCKKERRKNQCLNVLFLFSAAKQSILSLRGAMDCFASLAMTAGAIQVHTRPRVQRASGVPHALWAEDSSNDSGASRGEAANVCLGIFANEANQSILSWRGVMDCFASLAMTAGATIASRRLSSGAH